MPYNKLRPTDEFLVNRGTNSYKTTVESLRIDSPVLKDTDQFLVQRGVNSYRISKVDLEEEIGNSGPVAAPVVISAVLDQDQTNANRFTNNSFTTTVTATNEPTALRMSAKVVGALSTLTGSSPIVTNTYDGTGGVPLTLQSDPSDIFSVGDVVQDSASYTPVSSEIVGVRNFSVEASDNLGNDWTPYILTPGYGDQGPESRDYVLFVEFKETQTLKGNIKQVCRLVAGVDTTLLSLPIVEVNDASVGVSTDPDVLDGYIYQTDGITIPAGQFLTVKITNVPDGNRAFMYAFAPGPFVNEGTELEFTDETDLKYFQTDDVVQDPDVKVISTDPDNKKMVVSGGEWGGYNTSEKWSDNITGGPPAAGYEADKAFDGNPATGCLSNVVANAIVYSGTLYDVDTLSIRVRPTSSPVEGEYTITGDGIETKVISGIDTTATLVPLIINGPSLQVANIRCTMTSGGNLPGISQLVLNGQTLVDGPWNQSENWMKTIEGNWDTGIYSVSNLFDGSLSTGAQAADGNGALVAWNPITATQSIRVYGSNNGANANDWQMYVGSGWVNIPLAGGSPAWYEVTTTFPTNVDGIQNTAFSGRAYAIEVDGALLVLPSIGGDAEVTGPLKRGSGTIESISGTAVTINPFTDNAFVETHWLTKTAPIRGYPKSEAIASIASNTITFDGPEGLLNFANGDAVTMCDADGNPASVTYESSEIIGVTNVVVSNITSVTATPGYQGATNNAFDGDVATSLGASVRETRTIDVVINYPQTGNLYVYGANGTSSGNADNLFSLLDGGSSASQTFDKFVTEYDLGPVTNWTSFRMYAGSGDAGGCYVYKFCIDRGDGRKVDLLMGELSETELEFTDGTNLDKFPVGTVVQAPDVTVTDDSDIDNNKLTVSGGQWGGYNTSQNWSGAGAISGATYSASYSWPNVFSPNNNGATGSTVFAAAGVTSIFTFGTPVNITTNVKIYFTQTGGELRLNPGKSDVVIIDYTDVVITDAVTNYGYVEVLASSFSSGQLTGISVYTTAGSIGPYVGGVEVDDLLLVDGPWNQSQVWSNMSSSSDSLNLFNGVTGIGTPYSVNNAGVILKPDVFNPGAAGVSVPVTSSIGYVAYHISSSSEKMTAVISGETFEASLTIPYGNNGVYTQINVGSGISAGNLESLGSNTGGNAAISSIYVDGVQLVDLGISGDTEVSVTNSGTGTVDTVNAPNNQITLTGSNNEWLVDYYMKGPLKNVVEMKAYLQFNAQGIVTTLLPYDPGPVLMGNITTPILTFPATFLTGQTPDAELPLPTYLQTFVSAGNVLGYSPEKSSNILYPTTSLYQIPVNSRRIATEEFKEFCKMVCSHEYRAAEFRVEQAVLNMENLKQKASNYTEANS